jgi:hypothetical protein
MAIVGAGVVCLSPGPDSGMALVRILCITAPDYPKPPHHSFVLVPPSHIKRLPLPEGLLHFHNTAALPLPSRKDGPAGAVLWLPASKLELFLEGESRRAVRGGFDLARAPPSMFYVAKSKGNEISNSKTVEERGDDVTDATEQPPRGSEVGCIESIGADGQGEEKPCGSRITRKTSYHCVRGLGKGVYAGRPKREREAKEAARLLEAKAAKDGGVGPKAGAQVYGGGGVKQLKRTSVPEAVKAEAVETQGNESTPELVKGGIDGHQDVSKQEGGGQTWLKRRKRAPRKRQASDEAGKGKHGETERAGVCGGKKDDGLEGTADGPVRRSPRRDRGTGGVKERWEQLETEERGKGSLAKGRAPSKRERGERSRRKSKADGQSKGENQERARQENHDLKGTGGQSIGCAGAAKATGKGKGRVKGVTTRTDGVAERKLLGRKKRRRLTARDLQDGSRVGCSCRFVVVEQPFLILWRSGCLMVNIQGIALLHAGSPGAFTIRMGWMGEIAWASCRF